jgi:hypothetical protein
MAVVVGLAIILGGTAQAASCGTMTKRLARLRAQYQEYASTAKSKGNEVTFDGLVEILDKIVDLKAEMRRMNCKVPPRPAEARGKE